MPGGLRSSTVRLGFAEDARTAQALQHSVESVRSDDLCILPVHHPRHPDSVSVRGEPEWD